MPFSKSAVCESKKSKLIIEQEASRLLSSLFLLGDKFMPEMHLNLHIVLVDHLQKTKKEYKNLKKQEIHDIFIKTN